MRENKITNFFKDRFNIAISLAGIVLIPFLLFVFAGNVSFYSNALMEYRANNSALLQIPNVHEDISAGFLQSLEGMEVWHNGETLSFRAINGTTIEHYQSYVQRAVYATQAYLGRDVEGINVQYQNISSLHAAGIFIPVESMLFSIGISIGVIALRYAIKNGRIKPWKA